MPTPEELIRAEEREQAKIDLFVESIEQDALEEIDYLLHNEERRDPEIFEMVGADPEITVDEYEAIPVEDRDAMWLAGLSAMVVACRLQFFATNRKRVLGLFSSRAKNIGRASTGMDRQDLVRAAKQGISKAGIKAAREEMQRREAGEAGGVVE